MPVPISGLKVGYDTQKDKFLTIFGRPKTGIFGQFRGVPGRAPLATNHAASGSYFMLGRQAPLWPAAAGAVGQVGPTGPGC